ncbi:MAG: polymerase III subunit delta protein [Parcubacteria group bacterium GW2011_GWA2_47_7]|nr:MAG: polymerase III subunit delta protein [Parcubacteria group bacterium GW2011_GWA2_47_7]
MDLRPHIALPSLSHAYVIEGARASGLSALRDLMESFGIAIKANPDYHEYEYETFSIDHARELRREQGMHGSDGQKKIFVVAFNAIGHESQNALLKTLEEPTDNTHFFFLVRSGAMLLPTVRSRVQLISPNADAEIPTLPLAGEFLRSSISSRMKMIEPMTKAKTDDKPRAKEEARVFVEALEPLVYQRLTSDTPHFALVLQDILTAKRELAGRSPSVKLLLEHLALTVPIATL